MSIGKLKQKNRIEQLFSHVRQREVICPQLNAGSSYKLEPTEALYLAKRLPNWKIHDSDEVAAHYYNSKQMQNLLKKVVSVKVRIIPKDGNRALLLEIYGGKGYCEGIDFSKIRKIECRIEMNCLNRTYRMVGGLFMREFVITICEPHHRELIKWNDIP